MTMLTRRSISAAIPILVVLITATSLVAAQRTRKPRPLRIAPGMSPQLQGDLKPGQTVKFAIRVVPPGGILVIEFIKSAVKYHIEIVDSKDNLVAEWRREERGMPRRENMVGLEGGNYTLKFSASDSSPFGAGHFMLFLRLKPKEGVAPPPQLN